MKMLLFFIALLCCFGSCKQPVKVPQKLADIPTTPINTDSIKRERSLDSINKIVPLMRVGDADDKEIINKFIETETIEQINGPFELKVDTMLDKDGLPYRIKNTFYNRKHVIVVQNDTPGIISLSIDHKALKLHKNLIAFKGTEDLEGSNIIFSTSEIINFNFAGRDMLAIRGEISNCNGSGCAYTFKLLFEPRINRGLFFSQIHSGRFAVGKLRYGNELSFVYDDNVLFPTSDQAYMPYAAEIYSLTKNGEVVSAKDASGKNYFWKGFSKYFSDSVFVTEANFPQHQ